MTPVTPVIDGLIPDVFQSPDEAIRDLPAQRCDDPEATIVTRWRPTDEERAAIAAGGDVYVWVITYGMRVCPMAVTGTLPQIT